MSIPQPPLIVPTQREHDDALARVKAVHPAAAPHAHGTWRRSFTIGGAAHDKQEYLHIFTTAVPNRFLVHLSDGGHVSWESAESVAVMLAQVTRQDGG